MSQHHTRKKHLDAHGIAYPTPAPTPPDPPARRIQHELTPMTESAIATNNENDLAMLDIEDIAEIMERELESTYDATGDSPMDLGAEPTPRGVFSCFPKIDMAGHQWLKEEFGHLPLATTTEIYGAFNTKPLQKMKNFWVAERASGPGRCGGGICWLTGRAFQQVKDSQLDRSRFPDYNEAKWQLNYMVMYNQANERARIRQTYAIESLVKCLPEDTFFKHTFVPPSNQLSKYYGGTGKHSMLNNIPFPKAEMHGGVAYIGPRAMLAFALANGVPVEKSVVRHPGTGHTASEYDPSTFSGTVHNVEECRKAVEWDHRVANEYFGEKDLNDGFGAPKSVIKITCTSFKDGFGSGKCKGNRDSVDLKSCTFGAPKEYINGVDNTFACALGLKGATGWKTIEKLHNKELAEMSDPSSPESRYFGNVQQCLPTLCQPMAIITDKAERPNETGTLGYQGDTHRRFGVSGKVQTPSCKIRELKKFLKKQAEGKKKGEYGWSNQFISNEGNPNGATFPACIACRKQGLRMLGIEFPDDDDGDDDSSNPCSNCSNWDLLPKVNSASLDFPVHKDYPTRISEGSPVAPPKGRDVFAEGIKLPFIKLDWAVLSQACKFAFFQASRPKKGWTQAQTVCYLKHCGVLPTLATSLHVIAKACGKAKQHDDVDYDKKDGIAGFEFPAAWTSKDIPLDGYIEAIMHLLFLGVEEANYELIGKWLTGTPQGSNLGDATFKKALQELLKDLRPFMLSWLPAYPLTGKKQNKLGTGSWVAENWITFVRISQFIYGWCARDHDKASRLGVDDVSRMVISFVAFVARCLTHGGIDDSFIEETELYLKEFLSAVRELDVRVRFKELNKAVKLVSERKGTEAWFLKSNYMSLINLLTMMLIIGPLVLWWDGGGKGERFIQAVKPHIKRGVRDDALAFFAKLLERLFQVKQMEMLEKRYGLTPNKYTEECTEAVLDIIIEIAEQLLPETQSDAMDNKDEESEESAESDEETDGDDDTTTLSDALEEEEDDSGDELPSRNDAEFSANQMHGMTKKKTIYVYRNEQRLNEAIAAKKPIAGIVEVKEVDGKTAFEFHTVYRKPVKQFARRKVTFDDADGIFNHGLWCAKISVQEQESVQSTSSFSDIQAAAQLSAVAIPLWYIIGKDHPDSFKYCVITNWWKYRMRDGWYRLPTLDASLYGGHFPDCESDESLSADSNAGDTDDITSDDSSIEFPIEATARGNTSNPQQTGEI